MKKIIISLFFFFMILSLSVFVSAQTIVDCFDSDDGINYDLDAYVEITYDNGSIVRFNDVCDSGHPRAYFCDEAESGIGYWSSISEELTCIAETSSQKPDLVVTDMLFISENPVESEVVRVKVFVENNGKVTAHPKDINLDSLPIVENIDFMKRIGGEDIMEVILSGDSVGYETDIRFSGPGYYNITFFINEEEDINLENNEFTKELFVNCANGCFYSGECTNYGDRLKDIYCSSSGDMINQKTKNEECLNNYECKSNLCLENECVSKSIISKFLRWLKNLFS